MQQQVKKHNPFAKFHVLLGQMPGVDKEEMVWQYSGLLTTSLREFYDKKPYEFGKMIEDMQRIVDEMNGKKPTQKRKAQSWDKTELKKLRSAVLHRLQKHGIDTTDWDRVNSFMHQPRIAGKTLGEMSIEELRKFIPKMESILVKDKTIRDEYKRLAQIN
ncbi:hypothetical protein [Limibacterium fermenti]|uniref:hypothetical protein n=1 Tax=Limibacterium fermenti TaxID=3229863 RepID=UPI000E93D59A|nr:hypothetical protein [Porphyromonadaceae bacterium]